MPVTPVLHRAKPSGATGGVATHKVSAELPELVAADGDTCWVSG